MCRQNSPGHLSVEEAIAPEESLLIYCKPVELYNILHRRAFENVECWDRNFQLQGLWQNVTEEFTCPFCLIQCSSFKGLRYHLCSSHDLFNFEFWVTDEFQAVNVSVKVDLLDPQMIADGVHPQQQTFFFCSKPRIRNKSKDLVQNSRNVFLHFLEDLPKSTKDCICEDNAETVDDGLYRKDDMTVRSCSDERDLPNGSGEGKIHGLSSISAAEGVEYVSSSCNTAGVSIAMAQSYPDTDFVFDLAQPAMVQSAKTRKLSAEQSASRNRMLLQKRQFFHSHRAQPMDLDQVLTDRDSEDEVDDEIADFEDRRMLDDFVDVSKDEKHFMHLWNSFVRKQRVLADGHVPWACKAFSELHGQALVQVPALFWCWRFFMIKLWNHGLLDAVTMNNCNVILEGHRIKGSNATDC